MCQRLVCQKSLLPVKFNDPKFKNEFFFVRIGMKNSYFSNHLLAINFFCVGETVVVCQKLIHVYA